MKPRYRVPSMAEIAAIPFNGLVHASTFSGCGGTSLGFRMAGFTTAWANERDAHAVRTYRANFPNTFVDSRDIRNVAAADILAKAGVRHGELDVFEGSPPCQPFSMMGKRAKGWGTGDKDEERFVDWIRLVEHLMPRSFVAENVAAMAVGPAKPFFNEIMRRLKALGYSVEARKLDAHWLGVPQHRERLIIIGVRRDLGVEPNFPSPNQWQYGVRDALPTVVRVEGYEFHRIVSRSADLPMPTFVTTTRPFYVREVGKAGERKLTIDEVKSLCGFPTDFTLDGSETQKLARLGNAVPPPMAYAIACALRDTLRLADRSAAA